MQMQTKTEMHANRVKKIFSKKNGWRTALLPQQPLTPPPTFVLPPGGGAQSARDPLQSTACVDGERPVPPRPMHNASVYREDIRWLWSKWGNVITAFFFWISSSILPFFWLTSARARSSSWTNTFMRSFNLRSAVLWPLDGLDSTSEELAITDISMLNN